MAYKKVRCTVGILSAVDDKSLTVAQQYEKTKLTLFFKIPLSPSILTLLETYVEKPVCVSYFNGNVVDIFSTELLNAQ